MAGSEIGSQTPAQTPSRGRQPNSRRQLPRLRLACLRCQRRKIRCDGELPTCKNCRNAGASCADGESARLRELPRAYIAGLKERISWLEDLVRSRCPDVDLSQGPACDGGDQNATSSVNLLCDTLDNRQAIQPTVFNPRATVLGDASAVGSRPHGSRPLHQPAGGANVLSHEVGLVSLGTSLDPRYIGPSSAYFLARVMLTMPLRHDTAVSLPLREATLPDELVEAVQGPLPLPRKEMAMQLCDAYFEAIHPQYPALLHQPALINMLHELYEPDDADPVSSFQVYMVLAIGSAVLSSRLRTRLPGESY
ncbi:Positive regulator of purine utilization [Tolypocladium ophioglossoides CBS 100239]|uniref:Positive regulator of purine utilization n=1 Tax=Tolypocladium ophioglossoides (strain CBS 100239) TaxID=1163406 RepID=A0A0L0MZ04_TOLOC|nr:Positive regulator of purine utilization [Tolypocladium ophioglossoides CBS 100239]